VAADIGAPSLIAVAKQQEAFRSPLLRETNDGVVEWGSGAARMREDGSGDRVTCRHARFVVFRPDQDHGPADGSTRSLDPPDPSDGPRRQVERRLAAALPKDDGFLPPVRRQVSIESSRTVLHHDEAHARGRVGTSG
jgi:hypothetical protein